MTDDVARHLEIHCDLQLDAADLQTRLLADGRHLRLVTSDTSQLWRHAASGSALGDSSLRAALRTAGSALDQAELSAEVIGPQGRLVSVGHGCGTPVGRLLSGSRFVGLGSVRALASVVLGRLQRAPRG